MDMSKGYQELPVNLKVIAGMPYIMQISTARTQEQPIRLVYRTRSNAGPVENQLLYYSGNEIPDASLACSYTYGTPMGKRQILVYDVFFVTLFFAAVVLLNCLTGKYPELCKKCNASVLLRCIATMLLGWIWIFSVYYLFIQESLWRKPVGFYSLRNCSHFFCSFGTVYPMAYTTAGKNGVVSTETAGNHTGDCLCRLLFPLCTLF